MPKRSKKKAFEENSDERYGSLDVTTRSSWTVRGEEARAMDTVIEELGLKTTGPAGYKTVVCWPALRSEWP